MGKKGSLRVIDNFDKKFLMAKTADIYRKLYKNETIN